MTVHKIKKEIQGCFYSCSKKTHQQTLEWFFHFVSQPLKQFYDLGRFTENVIVKKKSEVEFNLLAYYNVTLHSTIPIITRTTIKYKVASKSLNRVDNFLI